MKLKPPMPKFSKLKIEEIDAIYAYLHTIPPKAIVLKECK
jgi:hypothetical protein